MKKPYYIVETLIKNDSRIHPVEYKYDTLEEVEHSVHSLFKLNNFFGYDKIKILGIYLVNGDRQIG